MTVERVLALVGPAIAVAVKWWLDRAAGRSDRRRSREDRRQLPERRGRHRVWDGDRYVDAADRDHGTSSP